MRRERRWFCLAALAALLPIVVLLAAEAVSDDHLYDQVRLRLASDRDVGSARIEVTVKDGVVTLRGTVPKEKLRQKAEKLARRVKGVRAVVNEIQIAPR